MQASRLRYVMPVTLRCRGAENRMYIGFPAFYALQPTKIIDHCGPSRT